jgi:error-prone DNA polymerase
VIVRTPLINRSLAQADLEEVADVGPPGSGLTPYGYTGPGPAQPAVRLGLSSVRTISLELAEQIVAERLTNGGYLSMADLSRRVGLTGVHLEALATAGAFSELGIERREALWGAGAAGEVRPGQLDLEVAAEQRIPPLPELSEPEQLMADLWATGITTAQYPTALIRSRLTALGAVPTDRLKKLPNRTRITVAGIVTHRQRPATARGVTFINLEDEFGMVNVICDAVIWDRHRRVAREAGGLVIRGMIERSDGAVSLSAERIERLDLGLRTRSRDFR